MVRKKFLATFISSLLVLTSVQVIVGDNNNIIINEQEIVTETYEYEKSIISERLINFMQKNRSGLIPVTVQIKDEIDLKAIENQAMNNCNITYQEIQDMEQYGYTLSEEENVVYQQQMLAIYDDIRYERNKLIERYYKEAINKFVDDVNWDDNRYGSVGKYTPFVRNVYLTVEEIYALADSGKVKYIDYTMGLDQELDMATRLTDTDVDYQSVNDTIAIIRGNIAKNNGYKGSGVKVGVIEEGLPIVNVMGTDATNITYAQSGPFYTHSTMVCGIIKKMAPDCSLYVLSTIGFNTTENKIIAGCERLINEYNVNVINVSMGSAGDGNYSAYSAEIDTMIKNTNVSIVFATGNNGGNVSAQAIAPNAIAVNNVKSTGTNQTASGAYSWYYKSAHGQNNNVINKPDICAPGVVSIYSYSNDGTSFSAPHVTGTIVQMISRNAGMGDKPTVLKAAILASGTYGMASKIYLSGTIICDREGAGVIDAGFCYDVAKNGRRTHFDLSYTETSCTYDVYCDSSNSPFRIACAWEVNSVILTQAGTNTNDPDGQGVTYCNDYNLEVYKNGQLVASSSAPSSSVNTFTTNYEVVELSPDLIYEKGAGYYQVKLVRNGNATTSGWIRVGLAWEQSY